MTRSTVISLLVALGILGTAAGALAGVSFGRLASAPPADGELLGLIAFGAVFVALVSALLASILRAELR